jgi:ectoine hydroxylase-related dioxygenase (phytanoyl-CoA dioxygenase family)
MIGHLDKWREARMVSSVISSGVLGGSRPEIEARDASARELDRLLTGCGAVLLRRFLDAAVVASLIAVSETLYRDREEKRARGELTEKQEREFQRSSFSFRELNERFPQEANAVRHPHYVGMATRYLQKEPTPWHITAVRRVNPGNAATILPFHQDQAVIARPSLNLWVALTPCGRNAPGLEMVLTDKTDLLETYSPEETPFATNRQQIDPRLVERTFGSEALWRPEFTPGDAMIFKGTTVHRSHVTPTMSESRLDAEMRLV